MTNINLYSEFRHDFSRPLTIEPKKQVTKQFNSSLFLGKTSFKPNQSINTPAYLFKGNSSKDLVTAKLKTNPRRKRRLYWINKTRYFLSKNNLFTIYTPGIGVGSQPATTNTIRLLKPSVRKGVNSRFGQSFRNFNQLVDLNYQVYNRVIRFTLTSSRLTNSVSTNSTTFEPQLIAFWKSKYPHSLRVITSENEPLCLKKTSKIIRPIKPLFLKFKSVNKDLTLLNKVLLLQAKNPSYSLETEVLGFFKQSRRQFTKSLDTLGLFSLHYFYPLLEGQVSITPYSQVYKTPALSSQFFWILFFNKLCHLSRFSFHNNIFFFKNFNLLKSNHMNHNNSLRLLTLNHFFTSNRLLCRNSGSNSSKRRALRVTTSVSGGTGSKIFLQNKHSLRRVLPFYKNYYMFIEFAKTFNRWVNRRPIYSHFFSTKFLHNKYLVIITDNFKVIPFWKNLYKSKNSINFNLTYGLYNTFFFKSNDNLLETYYDLNFLNFIKKSKTTLFSQKQHRLYANILSYCSETSNTSLTTSTIINSIVVNSNVGFSTEATFSNTTYLVSSLQNMLGFWQNPLLFKFLFWNDNNLLRFLSTTPAIVKFTSRFKALASVSPILWSNLLPLSTFNYTIKRKIIKMVVSNKYLPRTTLYFYKTLVNFIEFYTGKRVYLKFNPFIENSLTYSDLARCYMWFGRVNPYQRILGHRIFVHESLRIFHLALRFKDPTFLSNWIKAMLYRMSFWKYRILFRYIKYVLRTLFISHFEDLNFKGLKLTLRGKISVAGNARARTLTFSVGKTSHAEMDNRILSDFTTIHSFTGVMGFRLSFYF